VDEQLRKLQAGNETRRERERAIFEDEQTRPWDVLAFANLYGWPDDFGHLYLDVLDEFFFWTRFDPYDRPSPIEATAWFIYGCLLRDAYLQVWLANGECAAMKTHREKAMAGDWPIDTWTPKDRDAAVAMLQVEHKLQLGEWPLWESPEDVKKTVLAMADTWRDEWAELCAAGSDCESAAREVIALESVDRVREWKASWKKSKEPLLRNLVGDGKGTLTKG